MADMPGDEAALWDWLTALDDASRSTLLAHCVSYGVNALFEKADRYGGNGVSSHGLRRRIDQADRLARAVNLDMVEAGWRPTVENYLGRVTKSRILEAVREAKGESSGAAHRPSQEVRDGEGGRAAARRHRLAPRAAASRRGCFATPNELAGSAEPLPEFLADDDDEAGEAGEDEQPHTVAAE